ncbi:MAG: hypothetical protein K9J17_05705 [Flavobacteriales bacterium]|nr:hypothetical protein [Flavobacteriales bacterium]
MDQLLSETSFYLSIVATTRNDDHGGDLLRRTQTFLNSVYHQAKRTGLQVELILVEWNPPADRPLLKEVLIGPGLDVPVMLRVIVVPPEVHNSYAFSKSIGLYQMTAKNVGIRRAKGGFVLCTNIDIVFSNECFDILSNRSLKKGKYYRTNRCDVPKEIMDVKSFDGQLKYASQNMFRRMGKTQGQEAVALPKFIYWFPRVAAFFNSVWLYLWRLRHPGEFPYFRMDTVTCGDFTLMAKVDWLKIDGYPELDMYSIHIDSMGLWSACAIEMEQVIFPYYACVYHIDHENGWESDDVMKTIRFLADKPSLDYSIIHRGGMKMVKEGSNWGINRPDWGWANYQFEECVL